MVGQFIGGLIELFARCETGMARGSRRATSRLRRTILYSADATARSSLVRVSSNVSCSDRWLLICPITCVSRAMASSSNVGSDNRIRRCPATTCCPASAKTSSTRPPWAASKTILTSGTTLPRNGMKSWNGATFTVEIVICDVCTRNERSAGCIVSHAIPATTPATDHPPPPAANG